MKIRKTVLPALFSLALINSPAILADSMHSMAEVMMNLNHHPSESEKETLKIIANDSSASAHERTLATATMNLYHKASAADKDKLSKIMNDASAPANVRDLAAIIYNLDHKPSAQDKEKLYRMMQ